ncbi:MAG: hypothetical protein ACM31L_02590 [Actinomycetota bacterium]
MSLVVRNRHPKAMALAVALEIGALRLSTRELTAEAVEFNRRLWAVVRACAEMAGEDEECGRMRTACGRAEAALALDPRSLGLINRALAGILAGQYSSSGALRALIRDWEDHRAAHPRLGFEDWLLDSIRRMGMATLAAAA